MDVSSSCSFASGVLFFTPDIIFHMEHLSSLLHSEVESVDLTMPSQKGASLSQHHHDREQEASNTITAISLPGSRGTWATQTQRVCSNALTSLSRIVYTFAMWIDFFLLWKIFSCHK
jgi:hypothetical protein